MNRATLNWQARYIVAVLAFSPFFVVADAAECGSSTPLAASSATCVCGDELKHYAFHKTIAPSLQGFGLSSACDVSVPAEDPSAVFGTFDYRGYSIVSGMVRIEQTPAGNLFFYPDRNSDALANPNARVELRFVGEEKAARMLVPELASELNIGAHVGCHEFPAKLKIMAMFVIRDHGTDYDGEYITDFVPLDVGKAATCPK